MALGLSLALAADNGARAQQAAPQRLTLRDAIGLALKQNLSVRVASAQVEELEGTRERRRASLLPHVNGDALANRQNIDLAALGISFPGVPTVVGPFGHYDFRVSASQSLIDRHAYHNWKASEKQEEAAKLDYQDARDLVIRQAAGLYLNSQASAAEVEAAESSRDHFTNPGKTGARPARPGTGDRRGRGSRPGATGAGPADLLVARNTYQTSLLVLAHFLGLSPGTPLELAEPLKFHHVESADADQALHTALEARSDYAALLKQRDSLDRATQGLAGALSPHPVGQRRLWSDRARVRLHGGNRRDSGNAHRHLV